ncbi:MAG: hypothetical protein HQK50_01890 [Oligoflexia bacterium]|nr:hypothetical protein [Oligoflexia bacterium]MBF0364289.1 hypothetical protein [Oligoflexia bacterium]
MKKCPVCAQGMIHKIMMKKDGKVYYICHVCDSMWESLEAMKKIWPYISLAVLLDSEYADNKEFVSEGAI